MQGAGISKGKTLDALTNHIDLVPTILEFAGVEVDAASFDGLSLVPLLSDQVASLRTHNFGEYHPSAKPDLYNQTVSTDGWRLTLYPQHPEWGELFDLENDPCERTNIFTGHRFENVKNELSSVLATGFPPQPTVENEWLCKW